MAGKTGVRAQVLQASRFAVAVAILAVPRLCLAQEPERRSTEASYKGQTGGAVGTTSAAHRRGW
jgi:hypothetical protein